MSDSNHFSTIAMRDTQQLVTLCDAMCQSLQRALQSMRDFAHSLQLLEQRGVGGKDVQLLQLACTQLDEIAKAMQAAAWWAPAQFVQVMHACAENCAQKAPAQVNEVVTALEKSGAAVIRYVQNLPVKRNLSPVVLFPAYRKLLEIADLPLQHPGDLWGESWRWLDLTLPRVSAIPYSNSLREKIDRAALDIVKTGDLHATQYLHGVFTSLATAQHEPQVRTFWAICAAYFEALLLGLHPHDAYSKRLTLRVLQHYALLSEGQSAAMDALAKDLAFMCCVVVPTASQQAPWLHAVFAVYATYTQPISPASLAALAHVDGEISQSHPDKQDVWHVVPGIAQQNLDKGEGVNLVDRLDIDLFPIFYEEAKELLSQLGRDLHQWIYSSHNQADRDEVLRTLHTLKGSARLVGAMHLGEMLHRMESQIECIDAVNVQVSQLEFLLRDLNDIYAVFIRLNKKLPVPVQISAHEDTVFYQKNVTAARSAPTLSPDASTVPVKENRGARRNNLRAVENLSVRVRSQLLDNLVSQAGEILMARERMHTRLHACRTSLREWEKNLQRLQKQMHQAQLRVQTPMAAHLKESTLVMSLQRLEIDRGMREQKILLTMNTLAHELASMGRNLQRTIELNQDDSNVQGMQARALQSDVLRMRMEDFDSLSDRLYSLVRQASKDTAKQVKFEIVGGSIEIDKSILERMAPVFEHLLRNAVAHGIEPPAQRISIGKVAVGKVQIRIEQHGNTVAITLSDDGAGLDLERIRANAITKGIIAADTHLTPQEVQRLIFVPGLSTANSVTELAGRGVGMDVVKSEVMALGGRIDTHTIPGKGTTFHLALPLTTALTQVIMLRIGKFMIGVPSHFFESVLHARAVPLERAYVSGIFDLKDEPLAFFWAGALLQVSAHSTEISRRSYCVVVLRSAGQGLVLHVDEVLGYREVVVKNLGPQLAHLPGLAGMSVVASGAVILIYNPFTLANTYGRQAQRLQCWPVMHEDVLQHP